MKNCTACQIRKEYAEFHKHPEGAGGLHPVCRACRAAQAREKAASRAFIATEEKACSTCQRVLAAAGFYKCRGNRDGLNNRCKDCIRARDATRRASKPEAHAARCAGFHKKNPRYNYLWRSRNEDRVKLYAVRRSARVAAAPGQCREAQWLARVEFYGNRCAYCAGPFETVDHVVPLSRGGSNWPANLRPACRSCNSKKRSKKLAEWKPHVVQK